MALVRWQPFHELEDIQARLNRLFSGMGLSTSRDENVSFTAWAPAVDIEESEKEYLVKADLPEVKKEDVKVTVEEGVLTIEGERRQEKEEKNKRFHKIERAYGKFVRRFELPAEVDGAKVQADFREGVLNVHLPKSSSGTPKTIQVKVN